MPVTSVAFVYGANSLLGAGLCALLRENMGFPVVHQVSTYDGLVNKLGKARTARLLAVDLSMPEMRDPSRIRELRLGYPMLYLAAIGGSLSRNEILFALSAGVHGYIPSSASFDEIVAAIEAIMAGKIYVPKEIADLGMRPSEPLDAIGAKMTEREKEVMELLASGHSNKMIALALGLSEGTVKAHIRACYRKLGVNNRTGAASALAQMPFSHNPM